MVHEGPTERVAAELEASDRSRGRWVCTTSRPPPPPAGSTIATPCRIGATSSRNASSSTRSRCRRRGIVSSAIYTGVIAALSRRAGHPECVGAQLACVSLRTESVLLVCSAARRSRGDGRSLSDVLAADPRDNGRAGWRHRTPSRHRPRAVAVICTTISAARGVAALRAVKAALDPDRHHEPRRAAAAMAPAHPSEMTGPVRRHRRGLDQRPRARRRRRSRSARPGAGARRRQLPRSGTRRTGCRCNCGRPQKR